MRKTAAVITTMHRWWAARRDHAEKRGFHPSEHPTALAWGVSGVSLFHEVNRGAVLLQVGVACFASINMPLKLRFGRRVEAVLHVGFEKAVHLFAGEHPAAAPFGKESSHTANYEKSEAKCGLSRARSAWRARLAFKIASVSTRDADEALGTTRESGV